MPFSIKEFLDIQATIESGFTLKLVHDNIRTYSYSTLNVKLSGSQFNKLKSGIKNDFLKQL